MPNPEEEITDSCIYECIFGVYALVGGSAPDGYTCPAALGTCDIDGDVVHAPPDPIEVPNPDDPPVGNNAMSIASSSTESNSASYTYDLRSGNLYFSSGKADKGYGFFPSLTSEQLMVNYPSIAEEVSALKAMKSLASFKVILPALPASIVGRREA